MEKVGLEPKELLLQYPSGLRGSINALAELVKVNPWLAEEVIALAMVMGIYGAERKIVRDQTLGMVQGDLKKAIDSAYRSYPSSSWGEDLLK